MIKIALVSFGKIARDQHLPALRNNPDYQLLAIASRNASLDGVAHYKTLEELLEAMPELDAVSLCAPPSVRYEQARLALSRGKHVFLEKPPGATLSEVEALTKQAKTAGVTLFASWHSRYAQGVAPAKAWLAERTIKAVQINWKEDVRVWHPGQAWIWEPGGMGVFDPAINALSIVTHILPKPFFLKEAALQVPSNCQMPIRAQLAFDSDGVPIQADLDFLQTGPQTWDIHVDTDAGRLTLSKGGSQLYINGQLEQEGPDEEYPGLYVRFAELIRSGQSDVDVAPLQHVADAFMYGRRELVEPFEDQ
ncbi:D-galactose 1-dehydrogenase [Pseudomonas duriflava]|uniref:D-galactose 1-dehydrogenase n=1 Tax=Pseudomonas duriflava TaxID=459528 RepID=A0A562QP84_9PSED|nr:Gfo/Idh/MocA family oxidoreductase [Pseudomonas duriflava]TWI58571.1 D-galactose 1-dehydrogenase [Pseudomonas duriflava]